MNKIRFREFSKLEYGDPRGFLVELRKVEIEVANSATPEPVRTLRTNGLKPFREMREAALFCVGMSERLGVTIKLAPVENEDFDFVATWAADGRPQFYPVQLKELVPEHLNSPASIDGILESIRKYPDSRDLAVAIHVNRPIHVDRAAFVIPDDLTVAHLWMFCAVSADQSQWALGGDFLSRDADPYFNVFDYPT